MLKSVNRLGAREKSRAQAGLVWRSRPERKARGSGDSRITYLYNLTENWCVQSNRFVFNYNIDVTFVSVKTWPPVKRLGWQ